MCQLQCINNYHNRTAGLCSAHRRDVCIFCMAPESLVYLHLAACHDGLLKSVWCRCQASDINGEPGLLFGLKNPFRGLMFGNQNNDNESETSQAEQSQQQQAADKALAVESDTPWRSWTEVSLHSIGAASSMLQFA